MSPPREVSVELGDVTLRGEIFGEGGRDLVLIMGLGAQMLLWPEEFCQALAAAGHRVVRFDNRDVGLSTRLDHLGVPSLPGNLLRSRLRLRVDTPYPLTDMARDTLGLIHGLGLHRPLVVGASMGGMIAQRLALLARDEISGVVSVMSSPSGNFYPKPRALGALMKRPSPGEEGYVQHTVELFHTIGSQTFPRPDEDIARLARQTYARKPSPGGFVRQFTAILADGDRTPLLGHLKVPRLVIHGDEDPLVPLPNGIRTARAMKAPLKIIRGMAHDLPPERWDELVEAISAVRE